MDARSQDELALRRGGQEPLDLRRTRGTWRREGTFGHGSGMRRLTVDECEVFQSGIEDGELGELGELLRDWAGCHLRQFLHHWG